MQDPYQQITFIFHLVIRISECVSVSIKSEGKTHYFD